MTSVTTVSEELDNFVNRVQCIFNSSVPTIYYDLNEMVIFDIDSVHGSVGVT